MSVRKMLRTATQELDTFGRYAMKRQQILISIFVLGLLALAAGITLAQGPGPSEGKVQPQGGVSIAATVNSKFSYQGVLKENGNPVTGSRNMTFRLPYALSLRPGASVNSSGGCVAGPTYDPTCDVNRDGDTDVVDIELVAGHWGHSGVWTTDHDHWGES